MTSSLVVFSECLAWLVALMLAALVPSSTVTRRWSHAGWMIAFCAAQLLVTAQELVGPRWSSGTRNIIAIIGGMLLWEFARRIWNDTRSRRISPATHLVALECLALTAAAYGAADTGPTPGWFLPLELILAALPALLGGATAFLLWRCFDRAALRIAAVGLGLYGLGAAAGPVAIIGPVAPWLLVGGLARICWAVPATRTRPALVWLAGLLLTFAAGPLIIATNLRRLDAAQNADLLARAQHAVAPLQGWNAASLDVNRALPVERRRGLREHVENFRRHDPLLRDAMLWKLRGNRIVTLDLTRNGSGEFVDLRAATREEIAHAPALKPFITRSSAFSVGAPQVTAHGPITVAPLQTPVAWLALNYSEAFWTIRRDHARRSGVALIGLLAGFCAMGFVLAGRQAIESAQHLEIARVRAADKAKNEFLAFLSHELRTPLQTILGRAELLRTQTGAARHAAAIETQGRLLLRLVTDLLDLGTIEAGRFELRPQPFSLRALFAAIDDETRPVAESADLAFVYKLDDTVPDALVGDEMRLRQVLGNLLRNAIKYTPQGQVSLEVTCEKVEGNTVHLLMRVRDTGPGLPPKKIPQLFTLFTRIDTGDTFTREGTGVGLALVRRLCSLMNGTVAAANHPDGGAEFTVHIPFPLAASHASSLPASVASSAPRSHVILIAEDHNATRELLAEALAAAGHEVIAVSDGDAALAVAEQRVLDAVVLDINLPRRDGVAVARVLRQRNPALRIIGCSAEALPSMRETALAAGMDELLVKPVSLAVLAHAIAPADTLISEQSVFARLRSAETSARIRNLIRTEWPALRAAAESACSRGDTAALKNCAHYLQSTALLLSDETLLELCRRLSAAVPAPDNNNTRAVLSAFERHLATWSAESPEPAKQSRTPLSASV
jgi:signal transduction histidine kinase/CheY-like chemotaxis protein